MRRQVARVKKATMTSAEGLLVVGSGNLMFLLFFAVSTILLWHGRLREDAVAKSVD